MRAAISEAAPRTGETAVAPSASEAVRTLSAKWPGARKYDATTTRGAPESYNSRTAEAGPGLAADAEAGRTAHHPAADHDRAMVAMVALAAGALEPAAARTTA